MTIRKISFYILLSAVLFSVCSYGQPGKVQANRITIAYESFGSSKRETILLIGGTGSQLTLWPEKFCDKLVKHGYRVIRFDNRDIGLSTKFDSAGMPDWAGIIKAMHDKTKPPLPYTVDDMADDAVALLGALGIKKAHIVGASQGGLIAQRVAYNHPEHTLSLASIMAGGGDTTFPMIAKPDVVLKIPPPGPPNDTVQAINREVQTMTILAGSVYPPDQEQLLTQAKANAKRSYYPDGAMRHSAVAMAGFFAGRTKQLQTIKVPAVVIHGSEDPIVAVAAGRDVAKNIPGARFKLLQGMGHNLPAPLYDTIVNLIAENARKAKRN